jgi:hypothetical protein
MNCVLHQAQLEIEPHWLAASHDAGSSPVGRTVQLKGQENKGTSFLANLVGTVKRSVTPERQAPAEVKTVCVSID